MKRYFCFLRAINVGGHTVTMQQLKKLFESMGFSDVETFIASGNVIFSSAHRNSASAERMISKKLKDALGYDADAFVRTREELVSVDAFRPVSDARLGSALSYHVGFAGGGFDKSDQRTIAAFSTDLDDICAEGKQVYWVAQTRFSDSKVNSKALEKAMGRKVTFRNINTVRRLLDKYPATSKSGKPKS
ncbi:MAG: DUF1697 domain-containing protein [Gemmatimonadales bacterium]